MHHASGSVDKGDVDAHTGLVEGNDKGTTEELGRQLAYFGAFSSKSVVRRDCGETISARVSGT